MTTEQTFELLRAYESRNVTFIEPDGSWPMVWERANGVHVWNPEGRKFLDLTAAFGVAAAGHANPRIIKAAGKQMSKLLHAMGDVHPHEPKALLARKLSELTFERWTRRRVRGKTLFNNSGFESVEAALKTALLATRKRGVIGFHGGYHGLGYGALSVTHREHFRSHFKTQLGTFGQFVAFPKTAGDLPETERQLRALLRKEKIGAILAEPVQARGGMIVPPTEFLPMLRRICDEHETLLIVDEIYTGLGRTGKWFACEHSKTVPDVICLGKALTGGFPLSACVGRADLMDAAWPATAGEAIHTSTYLGHPVGCAMALAQIEEISGKQLVERSARLGKVLLAGLKSREFPALDVNVAPRGLGLMAGLELTLRDGGPATEVSLRVIKEMLHRGYILLPEGEHANVISFTPPLTITEQQLRRTVKELAAVTLCSRSKFGT